MPRQPLERGGGDTPSSAPQKLSWTLINEAVGNGHDWESAFDTLDFEIISGPWKSDRASPTSQLHGCETRRRCCEVDGTRYYARLVKNTDGQFALYQGNIKDASEGEAPVPRVKEEGKAVKEVRPPVHHCRSLLTQAHCSLPTYACSASCSSQHAQLTVHAVLSCVPFFLSLLPPTACRRRRKEARRPQGSRNLSKRRKMPRASPRQKARKQEARGHQPLLCPSPWMKKAHQFRQRTVETIETAEAEASYERARKRNRSKR